MIPLITRATPLYYVTWLLVNRVPRRRLMIHYQHGLDGHNERRKTRQDHFLVVPLFIMVSVSLPRAHLSSASRHRNQEVHRGCVF